MDEAIITTSWDDGHPLDVKLASLLNKYEIPATFYIPPNGTERGKLTSEQIYDIAKDFDIGGHTMNHVPLNSISKKDAVKEINEGKKILEEIIGRDIISFCYPKGKYNRGITELVKNAGFRGARTVKPFVRKIADPFQMDTMLQAIQHTNNYYMRKALSSKDMALSRFIMTKTLPVKDWNKFALGTLDLVLKKGGIWHLWGHSWEIEENKFWDNLESLFRKIRELCDNEGIMRMNNSDILIHYYGN